MIGTTEGVALAAVFFVVSHIVLAGGPLRAALVKSIGENAFRGLFSAVAIAALVWLALAYAGAPYVELWPETIWARHVPLVVMPFAAILVVCGLTTRNATAIGGGAIDEANPTPGIMKVTRHPFLWGVALWALAHIAPNGDAASLMLFGAIAILSFAGMAGIDRKRARALGAAWGPVLLGSSVLPFGAMLSGRAKLRFGEIGAWRILAGVALYVALVYAHTPVIGKSPMPF